MLRTIDQEKCIGCGACFKACGFDVFRLDTGRDSASPCQAACPAGIDIRSYAHLLQQGRTADAAAVLLERNPLPGLTCRVCPRFCESKCSRKNIDEAVNINALEQYLAEWIATRALPAVPVSRAGRVAIIGAGAAGMAAAFFMRRKGYAVTVYEREACPGGQFRTPELKDALNAQLRFLEAQGVEFVCGTPVGDGEAVTVQALRRHHVKAVIIATGAARDKASRETPPFGSVADLSADALIEVDPATLATRTNGVFAAGPIRGGSHTAPHEIHDAFEAAFSADRFINGWDMLESRPVRKSAVAMPCEGIPAAPRNNRVRSEDGKLPLAYETMILEANRCLTCGSRAHAAYRDDCMTCYFCEMACPTGAIQVNPFKERLPRTIEFTREGV